MEMRIFELHNDETKTRYMVPAQKVGQDEWKALCPRHKDHNPSLNINDVKKTFHCFGCEWKGAFPKQDHPEYQTVVWIQEVHQYCPFGGISTQSPPITGDFIRGDQWKMRLNGMSEIQWLWDGILPTRGISVILGKPKLGKSTFALNLADSITQGKAFLNRKVKKGKIIYMVLEGESLIDMTVKNWALSDDFLWWRNPLDDKTKIDTLKKWVESEKPVAIFIDNLQRFFKVKDVKDYSELSLALQPIEDLARLNGCHIVITHHSKKLEENIRDSFLGSTAGMGGVDTGILIQGWPPNAHPYEFRTFSTLQRCRKPGEEDLEGLVLNMDSNFGISDGGTKEDREIEIEGKGIIEVLKLGNLDQPTLVKKVGKSKKTFKTLSNMESKGKIKKMGGDGKKGSPYIWGVPIPTPKPTPGPTPTPSGGKGSV